ncbi:MAG: sulfatase [Pontiellaceae bacterium]|nr:sulfatase [Pontiellaceae bacterium]MBN2783479.1 sulfatase [Pontiellaceae bacterium]
MKKNVVFMFADQLAFHALKLYGGNWIDTPNIDRLATQGTTLDNSISSFPVCGPYRSMLMTGRHPQSTGHVINHVCTRHDEIGVADAFSHAGYNTGYVGKWHLHRGSFPDSMACDWVPEGRARLGWQYWRAYNQHMIYFDGPIHQGNWITDQVEPHEPNCPHWDGYETDGLMDYVREFISDNVDNPFILMLSPHQPHITQGKFAPDQYYQYLPDPIELPPGVAPEFAEETQTMLRDYLAMVLAIDEMLGNLLDFLDAKGLTENTYVVFTTDHGTQLGLHHQPPWEKQFPYEECIRTPFIIRGPGISAGARSDVLLSPVDIMPTLCSLCSVSIPKTVEGIDLAAALKGEPDAPVQEAVLTMNYSNAYGSLKEGRQWRGIRTRKHSYVRHHDGRRELYDLAKDPQQLNNLVDDPAAADGVAQHEKMLQEKLAERNDPFCDCLALRDWFDSERRVVANVNGPLPHPETQPDWSLL